MYRRSITALPKDASDSYLSVAARSSARCARLLCNARTMPGSISSCSANAANGLCLMPLRSMAHARTSRAKDALSAYAERPAQMHKAAQRRGGCLAGYVEVPPSRGASHALHALHAANCDSRSALASHECVLLRYQRSNRKLPADRILVVASVITVLRTLVVIKVAA